MTEHGRCKIFPNEIFTLMKKLDSLIESKDINLSKKFYKCNYKYSKSNAFNQEFRTYNRI